MTRARGAQIAAAVLLAVGAAACGSAGGKADAGGPAGASGGGGTGGGASGADAGPSDGAGGFSDGGDAADVATDFGAAPSPDVATDCPQTTAALAPPAADLLIDDFAGAGNLDGRSRVDVGFAVSEQFDATASARFDPAPAIAPTCGASGLGAAHVSGTPTDSGATFAVIFDSPNGDGGKPLAHYDASATTGVTFRVALGDAQAAKLFTLQVNLDGSQWDYTKDVVVTGTTWQQVTIAWTDLEAATAAPKFAPAALNQLVFALFAGADVDLYIDDLAFVR
jgi:hypothetical protein